MADFHVPDDIICNIIARLPAKPLVRFRCLSKYWYRRLREPNFMKLRSRKSIILPMSDTFKLIDETSNLIVERRHALYPHVLKLTVIGTLNGLVLLAIAEYLIVYNPLTGLSRQLPRPPSSYRRDARGFAYGSTPDDLKIVRFTQDFNNCDVFNFKEDSWTRLSISKYKMILDFEYHAGCFVNGFLYWIAYNRSVLIAVNVKDMVISEICLPFTIRRFRVVWLNPLGTMDGYLCSLQPITNSRFDMWVMKEENLWSIIYSFDLVGLPLGNIPYYALCILENRRVLMWSPCLENLIIYDIPKASYKTLNISISKKRYNVWQMQAFEYVETLVSPISICSSSLQRRRRRRRCKGDKRVNNNNRKRVDMFVRK